MKNSNFYKEFLKVPNVLSVFGPTWPQFTSWKWPVKNIHQIIQMNQGPISFEFSLKTVITFCSIWAFFGYKWAKNFPALVSLFILSDNFFESRPIFGSIGFPDQQDLLNLLKKKIIKKSNIQEAWQTLKFIGGAISSHIISFRFLNTSR